MTIAKTLLMKFEGNLTSMQVLHLADSTKAGKQAIEDRKIKIDENVDKEVYDQITLINYYTNYKKDFEVFPGQFNKMDKKLIHLCFAFYEAKSFKAINTNVPLLLSTLFKSDSRFKPVKLITGTTTRLDYNDKNLYENIRQMTDDEVSMYGKLTGHPDLV